MTRVCRLCKQELPETDFYFDSSKQRHRTECRYCQSAYQRAYKSRRREAPEHIPLEEMWTDDRVQSPVRYLLASVMDRAVRDLGVFDRPPSPSYKVDITADGVSGDPRGYNCDAQDALWWLQEYGGDFCELLDLPPEWARLEVARRMRSRDE